MSMEYSPLLAHAYVRNTFIEVKFIDQCDDVDAGLRRSASAPALLTPLEVEQVEQVEYFSEPAATAAVQLPLQAPHPDQEEAACPRTRLHSSAMPFVPTKAAKEGALTLNLSLATCEAMSAQQPPPCRGLDLAPAMAWGGSKHKKQPQQQELRPTAPDPGGKQGDITTVIMHNVPYSMSRDRLVELLEWGGFGGRYDFLYLPIDFSSNNSKGYCFVNLTDPDHMERFYDVFDDFGDWADWGCPLCQKRCRLQINRTQGFHANVRRYRNSALLDPSVPDEYKPAIFKDGVRIPFLREGVPQAAIRAPARRPLAPQAAP